MAHKTKGDLYFIHMPTGYIYRMHNGSVSFLCKPQWIPCLQPDAQIPPHSVRVSKRKADDIRLGPDYHPEPL